MNKNVNVTPRNCPNCELTFISAKEAAEIIGVSYARLRAILRRDCTRLEAIKIGREWIIPERAARKFRPYPPHRPRKEEMISNHS